jgi:hypothetical protein
MEQEIFNRHTLEQGPILVPEVQERHPSPRPPQPRNERGRFTKLDTIRQELATIQTEQAPIPDAVEVPAMLPIMEGPMGVLAEKENKKRIRRSKEQPLPQHAEMLVVLNDMQLVSSVDPEALGAAFRFIDANKDKITHLVLNGDISDYEQQTSFAKTPDSFGKALEEIEATQWVLEWLSMRLPNAKKVMIDGNHEDRWQHYIQDQTTGLEQWVKTPDEMFRFRELGFEHIPYGRGKFFQWHDRIFWHGSRAGAKANIPKLELEDAGVSTTTGHINRNMEHESRDALGHLKLSVVHAGFSRDDLSFVKKANPGWTQGFGVYYWDKKAGEQAYSIRMTAGNPRFIWNGEVFDGTGFKIGMPDKPKKV